MQPDHHRHPTQHRRSAAPPLALLVTAALLMAADCDGLRVPAQPARAAETIALDTQPARPAVPKAAQPVKHAPKADAALEARRFDDIRRGLRRLVVAEETYYAETGAYTDDLARLRFKPEGGSEVRFLWNTRGGWAASGTHPGVAGKDCVIFVGRERTPPSTKRDRRTSREGVPVCDAPPTPRSAPAASPGAVATRETSPPTPSEPAAPAAADTTSALDAVEPVVQMRVDLRNLVRSQEAYFGTQGVYARRMEPFALQYLWHRGVTITILSADDAAWSARAMHASRPGKSCVVWHGPVLQRPATEAQKLVPEKSGTPVCDD